MSLVVRRAWTGWNFQGLQETLCILIWVAVIELYTYDLCTLLYVNYASSNKIRQKY